MDKYHLFSLRGHYGSNTDTMPIPNLISISKKEYEHFLIFLHEELRSSLVRLFGSYYIRHSIEHTRLNQSYLLDQQKNYGYIVYVILKDSKGIINKYRLGTIPTISDRGSLILFGIEWVIVNQLIRNGGLYAHYLSSDNLEFRVVDALYSKVRISTEQIQFRGKSITSGKKKDHTEDIIQYMFRLSNNLEYHMLRYTNIIQLSNINNNLYYMFDFKNKRICFLDQKPFKVMLNTERKHGAYILNSSMYEKNDVKSYLSVQNVGKPLYFSMEKYTSYLKDSKYLLASTVNEIEDFQLLELLGLYKFTQNIKQLYRLILLCQKTWASTIDGAQELAISKDIIHTNKIYFSNWTNLWYQMENNVFIKRKLTIDNLFELWRSLSVYENDRGLFDRRLRTPGQLLLKLIRQKNKVMGVKSIDDSFRFANKQIKTYPIFQYLEQTNPLCSLTHTRRISLLGPGGLNLETVTVGMRDIHSSHFGKICPIETPEGKAVGIVNSPTIYAQINQYSQLEIPYKKVINGVVTDVVHYLDTGAEKHYKIAQASEPLDKEGRLRHSIVYARLEGFDKSGFYPSNTIDYVEYSSKQLLSPSSALIPFIEHNDGNRALMGSNMQRQAVPLQYLERPIIASGLEAAIARDSGYQIKSTYPGYTFYADGKELFSGQQIRVSKVDSIKQFLSRIRNTSVFYSIGNNQYLKTNQKTSFNQHIEYNRKTSISEGDLITTGFGITKKELSLGHNLLVGFMSMVGYTFEDSIVVSERVLRDSYMQSVHIQHYYIIESAKEHIMKIYNSKQKNTGKYTQLTYGNPYPGIVRVGATVVRGDILATKVECKTRKKTKKLNSIEYTPTFVKYTGFSVGQVIRIATLYSNLSELQMSNITFARISLNQLYFLKKMVLFYLNYSSNSNIIKNNTTYSIQSYLRSNCYSSFSYYITNVKNKHLTNFMVSRILYYLLRCEINKIDHKLKVVGLQNGVKSEYLNKLLIIAKNKFRLQTTKLSVEKCLYSSIVNNFTHLLKTNHVTRFSATYDLLTRRSYSDHLLSASLKNLFLTGKYLRYYLHNILIKLNEHSISAHLENDMNRLYRISVATKHALRVGDKLTGRYGNKGIISKIMPLEQMPYLRDGNILDASLNPLGVSSRMNIGQLFEIHLGWTAVQLGKRLQLYKQRLFDTTYQDIYNKLEHYYVNTLNRATIESLEMSKREQVYRSNSANCFIETSAFDSISDNKINMLSSKAKLNPDLLFSIVDPTTGFELDKKITLGYLYMMKLNHLVDHKVYARSTGPYNMITQQPPRGKSRKGGQRIGEMEVWAIQAYGASYALQELLSVKSDSLKGRRLIENNAQIIPSIDVPEAFNALTKELWSFGLDIQYHRN
uniref:DNA-directed RNA polymerase n=1 Tax=Seculamonas ecuadoriensis TaxID=221724 RepID=M4QD71_SECEC|nr:RNA polymerase subunit beta [Seculamonas ecuadoriensis]AGH24484.1 RNA polymerase subunit beta [Seculamonas ecuadoriensis]